MSRVIALVAAITVIAAATADAQFHSTLTFRPMHPSPAPAPTIAGGPNLRGVLLPWVWWAPVYGLESPVRAVPLAEGAPAGGVQLDILPWRAGVFLDGVHVGRVDDFRGYYHHLEAPAGPHRIVVVDRGYTPLVFDVVVSPGRTTTLRGILHESLRP
jgi:hypothetical protein